MLSLTHSCIIVLVPLVKCLRVAYYTENSNLYINYVAAVELRNLIKHEANVNNFAFEGILVKFCRGLKLIKKYL